MGILFSNKLVTDASAHRLGMKLLLPLCGVLAGFLLLLVSLWHTAPFAGAGMSVIGRLRDWSTMSGILVGLASVAALVYMLLDLLRSLESHRQSELRTKKENEELSKGVVGLLRGVHKLSQKDLPVHMEVSEDATAPIAESLNLLTDEIARVLTGVTRVSHEISQFCQSVKEHSDTVIRVADEERDEVDRANAALQTASGVLVKISEIARSCGFAADAAQETTAKARGTVVDTVAGINSIREVIRETEKRIKRLGERSQEISSVVNLINSIAERTHILALNASIHAASAGEAGRGFVVIADEVQRLAENAREATGLISSLVNNIQTETSETVTIMNNVISEVVVGTRLAEQAGVQMEDTLQRTSELVNMVQQISVSSDQHARTAALITERAQAIKASTEKTNRELQEQSVYADKLVQYSSELVTAVGVFRLPDMARKN